MIFLAVVGLILLMIVLYFFRRKMIYLAILLLVIFGACLTFKVIKGFFPVPIGVRHLAHLLIPPKDLYEPVVKDKFQFYKKGYTKTYSLSPKYFDFYDCGFSINEDLPDNYRFNGKLKVEFLLKDILLLEKLITDWGTMGRKTVSLVHFEMPFQGKYAKDIAIRLTVLEPDLTLVKYKDSLELFIGVSSTP